MSAEQQDLSDNTQPQPSNENIESVGSESLASNEAQESEVDWSGLFGDDDSPAEGAESQEGEPSEEPQPAPDETREEPAEEPSTEETPSEETAEPQQEEGEQAPEEPQGEEGPSWEQLKEQAREQLREHYKLEDADARRLEDDPASVLPEMAANLHVQVFEAVYNQILKELPQHIQSTQQREQQAKSFTERFHSTWPQLKGKERTVQQFMQALRGVDQNLSEEQLIHQAGLQAAAYLGLPTQPEGGESSSQTVEEGPGRRRTEERVEETPPPAGYKPARGGTSGGPNQGPQNVWEEIIQDAE